MTWEGEQVADMLTSVSNSVSYPHVLAHKRIPPSSLSGFFCTNYRTTETPDGPSPLYSRNDRGYSEAPEILTIQYLGLAVFANPCQLQVYETRVPHRPHCYGCTRHMHRIFYFVLAVSLIPIRHLQPRASRHFLSSASGGRTL